MSIFKESFPQFVQTELEKRQDRLSDPSRRYELTTYQSTRNSFVRMTSGVSVLVNGADDKGALAKRYVLQGGTLFNKNSKQGIGSSFDTNAYSNSGTTGLYDRGIRPMPGITNMTAECKTAYGSLIEAQVNFVCWDIKQLEDLELLFMRPGYTVLLEWGWAYSGQQPEFYDILDKSEINFNDTNAKLFKQCEKNKGNYEAILGYVKNYQWSARPDGGYDCTTYIISLGEVLESLKMNYAPLNINLTSTDSVGIIKQVKYSNGQTFNHSSANFDKIKDYYSKGILSGLLYEIQLFMNSQALDKSPDASQLNGAPYPDLELGGKKYSVFKKKWGFKNTNDNKLKSSVGDDFNYYITLGSLCDLVNTYIIPKNINNTVDSTIIEITTNDRGIASNNTGSLNCIAHPLQVSTDPTKCLIRGDVWINGGVQVIQNSINASNQPLTPNPISTTAKDFIADIPNTQKLFIRGFYNTPYSYLLDFILRKKPTTIPITKESLIKEFQQLRIQIENGILSINKSANNTATVYNFVSDAGGGNTFNTAVTTNNSQLGFNILAYMNYSSADSLYNDLKQAMEIDAKPAAGTKSDSTNKYPTAFRDFIINNKADVVAAIISDLGFNNTIGNGTQPSGFVTQYAQYLEKNFIGLKIKDASDAAKKALDGLNSLKNYFTDSTCTKGIIPNIYLDIDYLHSVLTNPNIEARDPQGKNTINILDFFKVICQTMQECTGNINNFDIHIDNRDNKGRIIDLNITTPPSSKLFQLELHNLKSMARSYKIESKIFPEQGSIIAISAQNAQESGQLGYNNSTLTSYNRGIVDRLKPKVIVPQTSPPDTLLSTLISSFSQLNKYFALLNESVNNEYGPGNFNNALRDMIGFLSSISDASPGAAFTGIIPITLSIDIDGIGGIVIGNLFKINDNILPSGYKGMSGVGRQLGFLVKGFNHRLENNDWITTIEAYPFLIPEAADIKLSNLNYWEQFFKLGTKIAATRKPAPRLSADYEKDFNSITEVSKQADTVARQIKNNKARYDAVASKTGVPWYVVGIIHYRESSLNFQKHLHNGDPLAAPTVNVPAGRPSANRKNFTFEESASDALTLNGFNKKSFTTIPTTLKALEEYNGLGYTKYDNIKSPYVWSGTNLYSAGKYTSDGNLSATVVDQQMGAAAIIKALQKLGVNIA
jgi:lysozyme family protein